jgi:hypothetical protein
MNTKWKVALAALVVGLGLSRAQAANPVEATITVTPVATLDLAISPTTYAYGSLDVNTSSVSATALTLTNNSQVSVSVNKVINAESSPAGWTAGAAAGANTYTLHVATAAARPDTNNFGANHLFGAQANSTALRGEGGGTPVLANAETAELWFKLTMPTTVTTQASRTIGLQFTAVAQ